MRDDALAITRIRADDPAFSSALRWEFEIFGVANDYASRADLAAGRMLWYGPYDASSEFYVARDRSGDVVGISRLIRYDPRAGLRSFSTVVDASSYSAHGEPARAYLEPAWAEALRQVHPCSIAELATQAIGRRFRRFRAIDALWRAMVAACRAEGVALWTMALVVPLFQFYKALFPQAIEAIGTVMPDYIGADSIPAVLRLGHAEVDTYLFGSAQKQEREGASWR